jgi:hypothetical protein
MTTAKVCLKKDEHASITNLLTHALYIDRVGTLMYLIVILVLLISCYSRIVVNLSAARLVPFYCDLVCDIDRALCFVAVMLF